MDHHLVYALTLILLAALGTGRFVGLGGAWERLAIVQRYPVLK
jgi:thiosulfate dehydrogenase (quinone) large subunit